MILSRILSPPFIKRVWRPCCKVRTEFHPYDLNPKWDARESWTKGEKREFAVYRTDRDNEASKIILHLRLHKEEEISIQVEQPLIIDARPTVKREDIWLSSENYWLWSRQAHSSVRPKTCTFLLDWTIFLESWLVPLTCTCIIFFESSREFSFINILSLLPWSVLINKYNQYPFPVFPQNNLCFISGWKSLS